MNSLSESFTFSVVFRKLMTLVKRSTLKSFRIETKPSFSKMYLCDICYESNSKGIAASRSKENLPRRYFLAIMLVSAIS